MRTLRVDLPLLENEGICENSRAFLIKLALNWLPGQYRLMYLKARRPFDCPAVFLTPHRHR